MFTVQSVFNVSHNGLPLPMNCGRGCSCNVAPHPGPLPAGEGNAEGPFGVFPCRGLQSPQCVLSVRLASTTRAERFPLSLRERIPRSISRIAPLNRPLTPSLSPSKRERGFNGPRDFFKTDDLWRLLSESIIL